MFWKILLIQFFLDFYKMEKISGIISLTQHSSSKYGKKIYVFGEYHSSKHKCSPKKGSIRFDKFVTKTLKQNPDKIIDIYTEEEFIKKSIHKKRKRAGWARDVDFGSSLDYFTKTFENCLMVNKKCKEKNVRVHYTDVRAIVNILQLKLP